MEDNLPGSDTVESRLQLTQMGISPQSSSTQMLQKFTGSSGGGSRSGTLSGLGLRSNEAISIYSGEVFINLQIKENNNDTLDTKEGYFMVSEVVK